MKTITFNTGGLFPLQLILVILQALDVIDINLFLLLLPTEIVLLTIIFIYIYLIKLRRKLR